MNKMIVGVSLLALLMTTGCGKETQTDAKEDIEAGAYKEVMVEKTPGDYKVELEIVPEEEMDYQKKTVSVDEKYMNETLPPLLQSITAQTGITFSTSYNKKFTRIEVEVYRNGNTMSNYDLKQILPNLDPYKAGFVHGVDIIYKQIDVNGENWSVNDPGVWKENGEFEYGSYYGSEIN